MQPLKSRCKKSTHPFVDDYLVKPQCLRVESEERNLRWVIPLASSLPERKNCCWEIAFTFLLSERIVLPSSFFSDLKKQNLRSW